MTTPKRYAVRRGSPALTRLHWGVAVIAAAASVMGVVLIGVGAGSTGRLLLAAGGLTLGWLALTGSLTRGEDR